jgi:lipopolysaccharide transport system ATP-binding protein
MNLIKANDLKFSYSIYGVRQKLYSNGIIGGKIKTEDASNSSIKVLDGLNFTFYPGDRVGLFGNNGAGKTTLLRILGGIFEPTSGEVIVNGKVGIFLDTTSGFDFDGSGTQNIIMRGMLLGMDYDYIYQKLEEVIQFSEIGDFAHLPVKMYSSGMLARLSFAIVNLVDPDIYLIDETIGTGDINFQKKISDKFKQIMNTEKIVICASHSKELIDSICNMGMSIKEGKVYKTHNTKPINNIF